MFLCFVHGNIVPQHIQSFSCLCTCHESCIGLWCLVCLNKANICVKKKKKTVLNVLIMLHDKWPLCACIFLTSVLNKNCIFLWNQVRENYLNYWLTNGWLMAELIWSTWGCFNLIKKYDKCVLKSNDLILFHTGLTGERWCTLKLIVSDKTSAS